MFGLFSGLDTVFHWGWIKNDFVSINCWNKSRRQPAI